MEIKDLKIALVHDFLVQRGGAERVLKVLSEMYPDAPIYTLLYDKEKMRGMFEEKRIRSSYLQKFPKFLRRNFHWLLPFFLVIPETFDFREYDLVISSSGAWSKGIVTRLDTVHISYLHSPLRFVWDYSDKYTKEIKESRLAFFIRFILSYVRIWDNLAAQRPDYLISNSKYTKRRVAKYYQRESEVIYPSVIKELPEISEGAEKKFFLVVSRLSPYKKVDLVVEAFNKLSLPLIVIGEGPQEKYLRKIARENIKILGWRNDETVRKYYANARGFIFPAEDDFGITAVEAMSYGVPVIAYKQGGACETVIEGKTGEFFVSQTAEVLADGVRRFMQNDKNYDKELIRKRAMEFSRERFEREFRAYVDSKLNSHNG